MVRNYWETFLLVHKNAWIDINKKHLLVLLGLPRFASAHSYLDKGRGSDEIAWLCLVQCHVDSTYGAVKVMKRQRVVRQKMYGRLERHEIWNRG